MERLFSFFGLFVLLGIAWMFSNNRSKINKKIIYWGTGLQFTFAFLVLGIPAIGFEGPLQWAFAIANNAIIALLDFTAHGSRFVFGDLIDTSKFGFVFALQVLPTIIFMAAIMSVAYHIGIMQKIVHGIALVMQKLLNTSGAESLSTAANVFVGQTEAPLVIKPYIKNMTQSELFAIMVGGMATVAGGVLAAYVGLLKTRIPDIAGHLLTASVLSAPATLVISKIMIPEVEKPETLGKIPSQSQEDAPSNMIEAIANGATEGLQLALNVGTMLLAFIALIAMVDAGFGYLGQMIGFDSWGQNLVSSLGSAEGGGAVPKLSLSVIFGWVFAPIAVFLGIPWNEALLAGGLLGEKVALNEFVAYLHLSQNMSQMSDRSVVILSYALCGFANFSSIGIQIGGISAIAPNKKKMLANLGVRAVIGGTLASFMTAAIAGLLT